MQYQAVLFDFDYTLGDSTDAIYAGFRAGFCEMGLPEPMLEPVRRTIGYPLELAYTMMTGDETPAKQTEFRTRCLATARPLMEELSTLFPGAKELLSALKAAGRSTAVVSTKHSKAIFDIMRKGGALEFLDLVIGGDQVSVPKPDPEGLRAALAHFGLGAEEVLFCGDTTIDAETARRGGTDFCAVLNGTTPAEGFVGYPCAHIAPNLPELLAWLAL